MPLPDSDIELLCADCGLEFILTVGEQVYFLDKGLDNPRRCKGCRRARRRQRDGGTGREDSTSKIGQPSAFQDQILTCRDCGETFTFGTEDQEYYRDHGFQNIPKRCHPCRKTARAERDTKVVITCEKCGESASVPSIILRSRKTLLCSSCHNAEQVEVWS